MVVAVVVIVAVIVVVLVVVVRIWKKKNTQISKWTGLFSVNGLGLNFCGIFEENKLSFGFREKREGEKAVNLV